MDNRMGDGAKKRTIAIVLPDLRGGGVERIRLALSNEFLRLGFGVDFVLVRATGDLIDEIPPGARLFDLAVSRLRMAVWPLTRYLREEQPDAVLVAMWPLTVVGIAAHRLARSKSQIVISDHNTLSLALGGRGQLHRAVLRTSMGAFYRLADARVAVSRGIIADLSELSGIAPERFTMIYNPIALRDPSAGSESMDPAELWAGSGLRLLSIGTLKAQKNHKLLIRAFAEVAKHRNVSLLILADGSLRPELEALVASLGLTGKVRMPGFIADPSSVYAAADLFVMTSDYEGFGNVLVEALVGGVPIVSTNCPSGPSEILENGRYGALVPCGDRDALVDAILAALDSEHDRAALRKRGAAFSAAAAAEAYLNLLFAPATREHDRKRASRTGALWSSYA